MGAGMTDPSDAERSWALAVAGTGSELDARALLAEAQAHAEQVAGTPEFRAAVRRIAAELLTRGELSGDRVHYLANEVDRMARKNENHGRLVDCFSAAR